MRTTVSEEGNFVGVVSWGTRLKWVTLRCIDRDVPQPLDQDYHNELGRICNTELGLSQ